MEQNLVFAFGPSGSYIYNAPKQWAVRNLPPEIQSLWGTVSEVFCAAFGSEDNSYFMSYLKKTGEHCIYTGNVKRDQRTKVALGPGHSFFAWDSQSMRWSDLPPAMEDAIQSWLSPSGWIKGPPRMVALGAGGTYFALSEYGSVVVSSHHTKLYNKLVDWLKEEDFYGANILHVSLSLLDPCHYLILRDSNAYSCVLDNIHKTEALFTVLDSLCDEETIEKRKANREKARQEAEKEAAKEAEKEAKRRRDADAANERKEKRKEEALAAEMGKLYLAWKSACDRQFASKSLLTVFPTPPRQACYCTEISCTIRKDGDGSLTACRHDMERLLRASGNYSLAWLKVESRAWHPDRFGQKCDTDYRVELCKKATMLYAIFGELIDALKELGQEQIRSPDSTPSRPPTPPPTTAEESSPDEEARSPEQGRTRITIKECTDAASDFERYHVELKLKYPKGAVITNITFYHRTWLFGEYNGNWGMFPREHLVLNNVTSYKTGEAKCSRTSWESDELSFVQGSLITNIKFYSNEIWYGTHRMRSGFFPRDCITLQGIYMSKIDYDLHLVDDMDFNTGTAIKEHSCSSEDELSFSVGSKITNIEFHNGTWWRGCTDDSKPGLFPRDTVLLNNIDGTMSELL